MIESCTTENIAYTSFAYFCIGAIIFFFFGYAKARDILGAILVGIGGTSGFLLLFTILLYSGERAYWFDKVTQLQEGILPITNAELFVISLAVFSLSLLLIIAVHSKSMLRL